jgi:hypothetical protein
LFSHELELLLLQFSNHELEVSVFGNPWAQSIPVLNELVKLLVRGLMQAHDAAIDQSPVESKLYLLSGLER